MARSGSCLVRLTAVRRQVRGSTAPEAHRRDRGRTPIGSAGRCQTGHACFESGTGLTWLINASRNQRPRRGGSRLVSGWTPAVANLQRRQTWTDVCCMRLRRLHMDDPTRTNTADAETRRFWWLWGGGVAHGAHCGSVPALRSQHRISKSPSHRPKLNRPSMSWARGGNEWTCWASDSLLRDDRL